MPFPQLKLDCLFQCLAPSGTCLAGWIALADCPECSLPLSSPTLPMAYVLNWVTGGWEKQEGEITEGQSRCCPFPPYRLEPFVTCFSFTTLSLSPEQEKNNRSSYRQSYTLSYTSGFFSPLFANTTEKAFVCPRQGDNFVLGSNITCITHSLSVLDVLESVWPFCIFRKGHTCGDSHAGKFVLYTGAFCTVRASAPQCLI